MRHFLTLENNVATDEKLFLRKMDLKLATVNPEFYAECTFLL